MILTLTRSITEGHGFYFSVPNYRISELLSSHGESRNVTEDKIRKFANSGPRKSLGIGKILP